VRPERAKRKPNGISASHFDAPPNTPLASTKGAHLQIVGEIQDRDYAANDVTKTSVTEIREYRVTTLNRASKAESTEGAALAASRLVKSISP
jgi:hypothetical protein